MKNEMKRQLDAQKKKAEDQYELDRLAQIEADRKNAEYDDKERLKQNMRKQMVKDALIENNNQLNHKKWIQDHELKQQNDDKIKVNEYNNRYNIELANEKIDEKYHRSTLMHDLK